jgi:alginate production protein
MTCASPTLQGVAIRTLLPAAAVLLVLAAPAPAQDSPEGAPPEPPAPAGADAPRANGVRDLAVGHWVRIKGNLREPGVFLADEIEVLEPADEESLIGTVESVGESGDDFKLLGQRVVITARTQFDGVDVASLAGTRVEVEGHWRGPGKFSARDITARKPGRDRLEGRIDLIEAAPDAVELRLMHLRVMVPDETPITSPAPLSEMPLAPGRPQQEVRQVRDDDDQITGETALTETLSFGGQLEVRGEHRDNYDLDDDVRSNRDETHQSLRGELTWEPDADVFGLLGFRVSHDDSRRADDDDETSTDGTITEAYTYWRDPFGGQIDLQVGRQDFDEPREWLYDENLDAVRAIWHGAGVRFELSLSTVLADGSPVDRENDNLIGYLSNGDWNRHMAAYVVMRTDHEGPTDDEPLHLGVRALGEWLPDNDVWLEASWLRGHGDDGLDRRGFGFDVGTSWSPPVIEPGYLIAGWAQGSGDDDSSDDVDTTFFQTGLQDNNAKFDGVTSYRYYGEVLDPELANLRVATLGVGVRPAPNWSLDLLWHAFAQPEPADSLVDTDLKDKPDGVHDRLGQELDLVFGWRYGRRWDVEFVLGAFDPGPAFPDGDAAYLAAAQLRWRF